jgi:hypothetical protein
MIKAISTAHTATINHGYLPVGRRLGGGLVKIVRSSTLTLGSEESIVRKGHWASESGLKSGELCVGSGDGVAAVFEDLGWADLGTGTCRTGVDGLRVASSTCGALSAAAAVGTGGGGGFRCDDVLLLAFGVDFVVEDGADDGFEEDVRGLGDDAGLRPALACRATEEAEVLGFTGDLLSNHPGEACIDLRTTCRTGWNGIAHADVLSAVPRNMASAGDPYIGQAG